MLALQKAFSSIQKFKIRTQPKSIFCNQQYGKKHCLEIAIALVNGVSPAGLRIQPTLVYAKSLEVPKRETFRSKTQPKKNIFEILDLEDFDDKGHLTIKFRVNDVSRNHKNQKFCVCLALLKGDDYQDILCTDEIKVISKESKAGRKRKNSQSSSQQPKTKRINYNPVQVHNAQLMLQRALRLLHHSQHLMGAKTNEIQQLLADCNTCSTISDSERGMHVISPCSVMFDEDEAEQLQCATLMDEEALSPPNQFEPLLQLPNQPVEPDEEMMKLAADVFGEDVDFLLCL